MGVNKLYERTGTRRERACASGRNHGRIARARRTRGTVQLDLYTQRGELYYELPKSTRATQAIVSLRIVPI